MAIAVARRPAERAYTLEVFTEATTAEGSWVLQAQFTAFAEAGGRTWTSPWVNLTAAPAIALPAQEARRLGAVRVMPTYRLLASGHEPAGTHLVRVVYRVRESGSNAAHDLVVDVPTYLVIGSREIDHAPLRDRVTFRGQPAHSRTFHTTAPSSGSTVLIERADIALTLDGSEPAGTYRYLIMFRGVTNP